MIAFIISVLFGAAETALIYALIDAHTKRKKGKFTLILLVKFITYAVAVWYIVFKYTEYVFYCICGFVVGVPLCAIIAYIIMTYFGKKIKKSLKELFKFRKKRVLK